MKFNAISEFFLTIHSLKLLICKHYSNYNPMKKHCLLLFCVLSGTLFSYAQDEEKIYFINTEKSSRVYDVMQENAPGDAVLKDVPRFALIGRDHKFYVGLGANAMLVGDYDWGHPLDNANKFVPGDIPMSIEPGNGGQFLLSAAQSDFYLNFVALPGSANQLGIFIDVNFMAGNHSPALHHAYLKYRGITAGHTTSIFSDMGAKPASIDYQGPNALTFMGHPNISYTGRFGKGKTWSAAIGLDLPEFSGTYSSAIVGRQEIILTRKVNQRLPDIPIYIQRSWMDGKGWFRASAIFRTLTYRDVLSKKNVNQFGWGVKLSGKSPICGGLSAMWEGVYGKGVSSYIQDLAGRGMDLMPDPDREGRLSAVPAWAAYGTLQYQICPRVFVNATYSHVRAYAKDWDSSEWDSSYKWAQYVTANCFWKINSFTTFGVEYLYGRRIDNSGQQAHDNRLSLMLKVSI